MIRCQEVQIPLLSNRKLPNPVDLKAAIQQIATTVAVENGLRVRVTYEPSQDTVVLGGLNEDKSLSAAIAQADKGDKNAVVRFIRNVSQSVFPTDGSAPEVYQRFYMDLASKYKKAVAEFTKALEPLALSHDGLNQTVRDFVQTLVGAIQAKGSLSPAEVDALAREHDAAAANKP